MKSVDFLVVHTEGSPDGSHGTAQSVDRYHRSLGWDGIGYHFFIDQRGRVQTGRPVTRSGAHTYGINDRSIGICVSGNADRVPFSVAQREALVALLVRLKKQYDGAEIIGHREINGLVSAGVVPATIGGKSVRTPKSCPGTKTNMVWVRAAVAQGLGGLPKPKPVMAMTAAPDLERIVREAPALIRAVRSIWKAIRGR